MTVLDSEKVRDQRRNPVPDRRELAKVAAAGGQTFASFSEAGCGCEALPFHRVKRRVAGINADVIVIAGSDFYDYVAELDERDMKKILGGIGENKLFRNVDCVLLEQIVGDCSSLRFAASRCDTTLKVTAEEGGSLQRTMSRHKKLVKLVRRMRKRLGLTVETITDREHINCLLPSLAALHAERWNFDEIASAFNQPTRIQQYRAAAQRALVTRVMAGDEILAIHYGLVFEGVMLWHTPVINLAFLDYSPLQILFACVSESCDQCGVSEIDMGLGDEDYKERFATGSRNVREFIIPISLKGRLIAVVRRHIDAEAWRARGKNMIAVMRNLKGAVLQRLNRIRYFRSVAHLESGVAAACYREIESWHELVLLLRRSGIEVKRYQYDRIRGGQRFVCLEQDGEVVSYGWIWAKDEPFFVGETGERISGGVPVLFDFVTPERHRRRGHYTRLLRAIAAARPSQSLCIFALTSNKPSIAGIQRAGYAECGLP